MPYGRPLIPMTIVRKYHVIVPDFNSLDLLDLGRFICAKTRVVYEENDYRIKDNKTGEEYTR